MVFTAAAMAQTHDSLKENLEQHVRILASDDMRGRLAGSADAAAAAAYISSQFEEIGQMFQDMIVMENMPVDKSVTRMLSARFYIGAEYELLNDIMSVGLLYQGRFGVNRYYNELTASYNLRPCEWFALSLSYSFLNAYNTIGWALHLTPPAGLNFYIGSDYTFFKTAARPYVLPLKSTYANIEFGLSVPIQGFKMKKLRQQGN